MDKEEIDFEKAQYLTNRTLKNDDGEKTGRLKMYSYDERKFHFEMKCPYCGHEQEGTTIMENRPYYINCEECDRSSLVKKLKSDVD